MTYATLCAGTDASAMALADFNTACAIALGTSFNCRQSYACDIDPKTRDFLKATHACLQGPFHDIHDLVKPLAYDDHDHQYMAPPQADAYIAGFPCQYASFLNGRSHSNEDCQCVMSGTQSNRKFVLWHHEVMLRQQAQVACSGECDGLGCKVEGADWAVQTGGLREHVEITRIHRPNSGAHPRALRQVALQAETLLSRLEPGGRKRSVTT